MILGVDTVGGLNRVVDDARLYASLLLELAAQDEQILKELAFAVESQDRSDARSLAHTLNGVAGNLGLDLVQAEAAALERLPDTCELSELRAGFESIRLALGSVSERIVEALRGRVFGSESETADPDNRIPGRNEGPPSEAEGSPLKNQGERGPGAAQLVDEASEASLRGALLQLESLLVECDGGSVDLLEEVLKVAPPGRLDRLARLVRQFDFDAALVELRNDLRRLDESL
jgi:HPt (histidine-containing phosphotransfer) domain-containing protein